MTFSLGWPAPVVEPEMARSSLRTVYQFNVKSFADGMSGAVNGMRPDGTVDNTCMQSKEVWTGPCQGACIRTMSWPDA
jgi:non-lysosomal glucosylceramidase